MMPQGHAVSGTGDPDTVRITATGSPETPAARLEQIALARAGEYGAELRKKTFVAAPSSVTVKCGASTIDRRSNIPTLITNYRVLTMDVTYPNPATDPTARPTGPMAETMKAALASETIDAATQAAAAAEVKAACKRGA